MRILMFAFAGAILGTLIPWTIAAWKVAELYLRDEMYDSHVPTMTAFMVTFLFAPAGAFLGAAVALDTRPDPSKSSTDPSA